MKALRRIVLGVWVACLMTPTLHAQNNVLDTGNIVANSSGSACTAVPTGCAVFLLGNATIASVTLQVSGTYVGTLGAFEATSAADPSLSTAKWEAITGINIATGASATAVTANGTGQFAFQNTGLTGIRVRATAWTSGTAVVTAVRGYATALWLTPFFTAGYFGNGTAALPSISFANDPDTGIWSPSAANGMAFTFGGTSGYYLESAQFAMKSTVVFGWTSGDPTQVGVDTVLCRGGANAIGIGGCTSSFPAVKRSGTTLQFRLGDDSGAGGIGFDSLAISGTAPTVTSAGTSPSVTASNGTATFRVNVGTGGTATTIVLAMPTAATGWNCSGSNITAAAANRNPTGVLLQQSSTTTAATLQYQTVATGVALAFVASDIVKISCLAY